MSGANYVHMIHTRINCLATKARLARGRNRDVVCRACRSGVETAYHVIQRCSRIHFGRIARHNKVYVVLEKALQDRGWRVLVEPKIKVPTTGNSYETRIPDLVCIKDDSLVMVDPQIVASTGVDVAYKSKQHKYMTRRVKEAVIQRYGANLHVECLPVTNMEGFVLPSFD